MTSKRSNTASAKGRDIAPGVPAQKGSVMEDIVRSVPDGLSPFGSRQQAVSPVPASIPSAGEIMAALSFAEKMQIMAGKARLAERAYDWLSQFAWGAADHKSQVSFKPSFAGSVSGVAEAVKYVEQAITDSLPEILEKATRAAADDLSRLVAQATETRSAKTEGLGPKDESAVAKPCAQGDAA